MLPLIVSSAIRNTELESEMFPLTVTVWTVGLTSDPLEDDVVARVAVEVVLPDRRRLEADIAVDAVTSPRTRRVVLPDVVGGHGRGAVAVQPDPDGVVLAPA
jgi:hypothetical protein